MHYSPRPVSPGNLYQPAVMAFQEVILTEKVYKLGAESDIVRVRAGYARNYLIPQGKALEKTKANLGRVMALKRKRAEREAAELNEAQEFARKINKIHLHLELETGETGKAFGSITSADLAEKVKAELGGNTEFDRHKIQLDEPIKTAGEYTVPIRLHHDVSAQIKVTVKAQGGERPAEEASGDAPAGEVRVKARPKK